MKYLSILKYVLAIVSALIVIVGTVTFDPKTEGSLGLDVMLLWAAGIFILGVILVLAMPLLGIAQNPKSATKSLIGLGGLVVVILLAYLFASDEPIRATNGMLIDNTFQLTFSDMGLYTIYIMFGLVVLSMIATEVYKSIKN